MSSEPIGRGGGGALLAFAFIDDVVAALDLQ
jgi:hypothetical protein